MPAPPGSTHALDIVILAAGQGTRMKSSQPKVLVKLAGRALLEHVLHVASELTPRSVVVVCGHGAVAVRAAGARFAASHPEIDLAFAEQLQQLGTGHAVQQALPLLPGDGTVLVLSGDVPLTSVATLRGLLQASSDTRLALLTVELADPTGYGRIVRDRSGAVRRIVEHKDATADERAIREIYSGLMAVPLRRLRPWLARLSSDNAQGEYYLTDVVAMAVAEGAPVVAHAIDDPLQVSGVNSAAQLAALERAWQRRQADALMEQGVRLADPTRFDLRGELICSTDVEIDVGCIFSGRVELGAGVTVGANCCIANATIAAGASILPYTHIDGGELGVCVGPDAHVGPFARLRPGAHLEAEVHVGNFVEVKNSTLARGAKANHLAYLGDAQIGAHVNYGAGCITANYDGASKHRTVIGDDVHVGSNSVLVAPVTLGAGGTVGAGSVITQDTSPGTLALSRARQVAITNWRRPTAGRRGDS